MDSCSIDSLPFGIRLKKEPLSLRNSRNNNVQDISDAANKKAEKNGRTDSNSFNGLSILNKKDDATAIASNVGDNKDVLPAISNEDNGLSESLASLTIMSPRCNFKRKLLVLDLNGLLADVVSCPPKDCIADLRVRRKSIFRRPFCLDFLKFCFERFEVGLWSSRMKKNIDDVLGFVMGEWKHKLLFCWDHSYCTLTHFNTLENRHKPVVFKELRRIWEKEDPNLPWEKGYYGESNTLLLDDSPYKALLNPAHTAIFPYSYQCQDRQDNALGDGGDIRLYLERLVEADNIQEFVERHPFGQKPINERNSHWSFYLQVLNSLQPNDDNISHSLTIGKNDQ